MTWPRPKPSRVPMSSQKRIRRIQPPSPSKSCSTRPRPTTATATRPRTAQTGRDARRAIDSEIRPPIDEPATAGVAAIRPRAVMAVDERLDLLQHEAGVEPAAAAGLLVRVGVVGVLVERSGVLSMPTSSSGGMRRADQALGRRVGVPGYAERGRGRVEQVLAVVEIEDRDNARCGSAS